jgi:hypothetical protein
MPEVTEFSAKQRRNALEPLERLAQITEHHELEVGDRRIALHHVDAIVRARRVDFAEVLGLFRRDELKTLTAFAFGGVKESFLERCPYSVPPRSFPRR